VDEDGAAGQVEQRWHGDGPTPFDLGLLLFRELRILLQQWDCWYIAVTESRLRGRRSPRTLVLFHLSRKPGSARARNMTSAGMYRRVGLPSVVGTGASDVSMPLPPEGGKEHKNERRRCAPR
jgi:hypothetical protein